MEKRGGMDNENKFYNIYRLCRKEGAWTTRTTSTIYIDYAEKSGMDNENKFYNIYRLCRKEGAWTTRTSSTIYIDYAERSGHGQRE